MTRRRRRAKREESRENGRVKGKTPMETRARGTRNERLIRLAVSSVVRTLGKGARASCSVALANGIKYVPGQRAPYTVISEYGVWRWRREREIQAHIQSLQFTAWPWAQLQSCCSLGTSHNARLITTWRGNMPNWGLGGCLNTLRACHILSR